MGSARPGSLLPDSALFRELRDRKALKRKLAVEGLPSPRVHTWGQVAPGALRKSGEGEARGLNRRRMKQVKGKLLLNLFLHPNNKGKMGFLVCTPVLFL